MIVQTNLFAKRQLAVYERDDNIPDRPP